jgi:hypothetical protein
MTGKQQPDLAQYFKEHPDEMKAFFETIRRVVLEQQQFQDTVGEFVREVTGPIQEHIGEIVRSIYLPSNIFAEIARSLDEILPENWPRPIPNTGRIEDVLEKDGLPIVHIPRAEIVRAIVDAENYEARIAIIEARADDIAEDCYSVLDEDDVGREKQIPLVKRAIESFQAGHFEAAQALAVSVCDTYLKDIFPPELTAKQKLRKIGYNEMAEKLSMKENRDESATWVLNVGYALASAVPFLVHWEPGKGEEPPTHLSRHVSIHFASTDHMTRLNATIAIMLATTMSVALTYPMRLMTKAH